MKETEICKNCAYSRISLELNKMSITSDPYLECLLNPPENVFTDRGIVVQSKVVRGSNVCSFFKREISIA